CYYSPSGTTLNHFQISAEICILSSDLQSRLAIDLGVERPRCLKQSCQGNYGEQLLFLGHTQKLARSRRKTWKKIDQKLFSGNSVQLMTDLNFIKWRSNFEVFCRNFQLGSCSTEVEFQICLQHQRHVLFKF
ncbi:hypothetical protein KFY46_25630, partial [Salmonella enterica subsp. enterica serovar 1,4,[5],12:i:-]|nr:hypothetical protein [Salmonella enterica subsp. enterica serovar 1,4,[5],12:i:-]